MDLALKDLDEFLEKKKVPFVRFGDDVMAFCDSFYEAKQLLETVQSFLAQTLNLQLNPRKTAVQRGVYGPFIGRLLCYDSRHDCHHVRSVRKDQKHSKVNGLRLLIPEDMRKSREEWWKRNQRERDLRERWWSSRLPV